MGEENKNNINSTVQENINEGFTEYLKEQIIKAFYEFDKFEFMAPDKDTNGRGELILSDEYKKILKSRIKRLL